ncbi:hypothetical protein N9O61_06460 [Octadecabacter sp.]|nr:hypothetical protein [Octadecabacter sp.]
MSKAKAPIKETITLLADDQGALASGEEQRKFLKAHLVQQSLTNTAVSVSDSFLINNPNLRSLIRSDQTIRGLVAQGILTFAVRDSAITKADGLLRLANEFRAKGSLRTNVAEAPDDELTFIQNNAAFRSWDMTQVSTHYAKLCKKALFSLRTTETLGDTKADFLQRIIEEDRGGAIERNLIYFELEDIFSRNNTPLSPSEMSHLRLCVDAPYHSNLPSLLGLDPAYDDASRASFELMRGIELTATEIEAARELPDRLDGEHYVHGLSELSLDAIMKHRDSFEFLSFVKAVATRADPDTVEDCFYHHNIAIESAILGLYPELQSRSSIVSKRKISKKVHEYRKDGVSRISDVVSIGMSLAEMTLPFGIGYCANHLLDYVRGHHGEPAVSRSIDDIAAYDRERQRLKRYLTEKGLGDKINQTQTLVETHSHSVETFVTNTQ